MNAGKTLLLASLPLAGATAQTDHYNLERGLPTRLEDAYPIAFRGRELQLGAGFQRTDDADERLILRPAFELGFARNFQGRVSAPFLIDDSDSRGSGDIDLETLYNFNQEARWLPALATTLGLQLPTGEDSEGLDTHLGAIASKTVHDELFGRVHLNAAWEHNARALADERDDAFTAGVGYSLRLGPDVIGVVDVFREWQPERHTESNELEAGVRWQLRPLTVLSLGVGVGIGDESPDFVATVGLQHSF